MQDGIAIMTSNTKNGCKYYAASMIMGMYWEDNVVRKATINKNKWWATESTKYGFTIEELPYMEDGKMDDWKIAKKYQ